MPNKILNLNNLVLHLSSIKVTLASTAVFSYAGLIPACLYGYLWWAGQGGTITISFLELVSSNIYVKFQTQGGEGLLFYTYGSLAEMSGIARGILKNRFLKEKKSNCFQLLLSLWPGSLTANLVQPFGQLQLTYKYIYMSEELYYIDFQ